MLYVSGQDTYTHTVVCCSWLLGMILKGLATQKAGCRGGQRSVPAAGRPSNCITEDCIVPNKQKAG